MTLLLLALGALVAGGVLAAPVLYGGGRRAAACVALALALGAAAAAGASVMNPEPRTNAIDVALWCAVAMLAATVFAAARRSARLPYVFAAGLTGCTALAAFGLWLLVGFRIFRRRPYAGAWAGLARRRRPPGLPVRRRCGLA